MCPLGPEISGEPRTGTGTETRTETETGTGTEVEQRRTATHDSYINILLLNGEEAITLKVQNQDHGDTYVRTGRNIPLSFLMRAYADGPAGLVYDQIRFIYDGKRIAEKDTAEQLGMEEGDVIDAMSDMTGGASF